MDLYGKFLNWFVKTTFWKAVGKFCATCNLRLFGYPRFPMDDYFKIVDSLNSKKFYAFLSTDTKTISSILIKLMVALTTSEKQYGLFSHAGIILPDGERNTKVMHVNYSGFRYHSLLTLLKKNDYLAVIELPVPEDKSLYVEQKINYLKDEADKIEYDWEECLNNDPLHIYCSEMLYIIFKNAINDPNFKPRIVAGKEYFDPDLILKIGKIVYTNHPKLVGSYGS